MPEWRLRTGRDVVHGSPRLGSPQSRVVLEQIGRQAQNGIIRARVAGRRQSHRAKSSVAEGIFRRSYSFVTSLSISDLQRIIGFLRRTTDKE